MAYYAKINSENIVEDVLKIPDIHESRGHEYLANDLNLGGRWIQTSFTGKIRKNFAGIGMIYDEENDRFLFPQPFPSWSLDSEGDWQPPVPKPISDELYTWNETSQEWEIING